MPRYFFRLDDVCPEMDESKFLACLAILRKHDVRPLAGVIPDNRDQTLHRQPEDPEFWVKICRLVREKRLVIAQHGLEHRYHQSSQSLLFKYGIGAETEFAGLAYAEQLKRLKRGRELLAGRGLFTNIFMAPNHSFDRTTLRALRDAGFRFLTDGIGLYSYVRDGIVLLPQLSGRPRRLPCGSTTICLHPASMDAAELERLDRFLRRHGGAAFEAALQSQSLWYAPLANALTRMIYFMIKWVIGLFRPAGQQKNTNTGEDD
jgi:predicted deacetylase